jgi:hypothetical protein
LVRVEDLRLAVTRQRLLQRLDAERCVHRDRQTPRQDPPREPVEHDREIDEALGHRNVGDVHRPDLIGPRDLDAAQQIRKDLVPRLRLRRPGPAIQGFHPHPQHQRLHVTPVVAQRPGHELVDPVGDLADRARHDAAGTLGQVSQRVGEGLD